VEGDAFLTAFPCDELRFSYGIELPAPVGVQWASFAPERDDFSREIAPARTFIRQADAERLRAAGGLAGGDLRCALVLGPQGWLNPPLRFENEPARHKLLDLLGDLALLGEIPRAHYVAYRAGHRLHGALARRLAS
jgi:UDP-3-O-[3-hydroxymyristoyl] N-acetylglucosamine deacetylase